MLTVLKDIGGEKMTQLREKSKEGYRMMNTENSLSKWEEFFKNDYIPPEELNTKKKVTSISDETLEHAFILMFKNYPTQREKQIFKDFIEQENKACHTVVLYAISHKFEKLCEELRKPLEVVEKREVKIYADKLFYSDDYAKTPTILEEPEDNPMFWMEFMV